jgi:Fe-S cluster biogenesis protein NfuA
LKIAGVIITLPLTGIAINQSGGKTMLEQVKKVLDEIRPNLQADGGDIELVGVEDGVVKVRLKGSCAGCPMSQMTLTFGVEKVLKERIPEVVRVEAVPFGR